MLNRTTSNTDITGVPAIMVGVPTIMLGVPAFTAGVSPSRTLKYKEKKKKKYRHVYRFFCLLFVLWFDSHLSPFFLITNLTRMTTKPPDKGIP